MRLGILSPQFLLEKQWSSSMTLPAGALENRHLPGPSWLPAHRLPHARIPPCLGLPESHARGRPLEMVKVNANNALGWGSVLLPPAHPRRCPWPAPVGRTFMPFPCTNAS